MDDSHIVSGLDIGSTKITVCIGNFDDSGSLSIIGLGTSRAEGIKNGTVVNLESMKNSIQGAIDQAENMAGIPIEDFYLGISGSHIRGLNSKGVVAISNRSKTVGEEEVHRVIEAAKAVSIPADHQILHVLSKEFSVDDQAGIKDPIGMTGIRLEGEVHIITGLVSAVQNLYKVVTEKGHGISDIVFSPLASSEVILEEDEKELGVLLLDMGGGTTDIMVYADGGVTYSSSLSLAGFHVTNDISVGLQTPIPSAEDIKLKYGCANPALVDSAEYIHVPSVGGRPERRLNRQELCQIIEPRLEEIFELVDDKLLSSGIKGYISAGAVVTGGSMLLEGALDIAERVLNIPVRMGIPNKVSGLKDFSHDPSFSTAIGLVKYGAKHKQWHRFYKNKNSGMGLKGIMSRFRDFFSDFV